MVIQNPQPTPSHSEPDVTCGGISLIFPRGTLGDGAESFELIRGWCCSFSPGSVSLVFRCGTIEPASSLLVYVATNDSYQLACIKSGRKVGAGLWLYRADLEDRPLSV